MLNIEQDESAYSVHYRSYRLALALLVLPPLMLFYYVPRLIDPGLDHSEYAALFLGVFMPLIAAYFLVEFASFRFSRGDNRFDWRWRNLLRKRSLTLPLERVARVRREAVETADSGGPGYCYRLVVVLDDETVIGLTRSYSGLRDRQLDEVVDGLREYLGHIVPMR